MGVVFCTDLGGNEYGLFLHEGDILLMALSRAIANNEMTVAEGRKVWESRYTLDNAAWEEWEEYGFPSEAEMQEWLPFSSSFYSEAGSLAIPSVYYSESEHPGGGPVFAVQNASALEDLRAAMAGRYTIIVKDDMRAYLPYPSLGFTETKKLLEQSQKQI